MSEVSELCIRPWEAYPASNGMSRASLNTYGMADGHRTVFDVNKKTRREGRNAEVKRYSSSLESMVLASLGLRSHERRSMNSPSVCGACSCHRHAPYVVVCHPTLWSVS
jgi:hypothetical protein